MKLIFVYAFLIFYYGVVERVIKNKLSIKKEKGLFKHFNKIHKWLEVLLIIGVLAVFFINAYYPLIVLTVLFAFRAFMEWKFEKESKAYILNILNASVVLFVLIALKSYI